MKANFLKNKQIIYTIVSLFMSFAFILPIISSAQEGMGPAIPSSIRGLVPCDGVQSQCDFNAFVYMINGIINWIIGLAGVIFTISLIYGGFLYVTSGANPSNRETAKKILWSTLKGFVIILISWVIVYTILIKTVIDTNSPVFRFIKK